MFTLNFMFLNKKKKTSHNKSNMITNLFTTNYRVPCLTFRTLLFRHLDMLEVRRPCSLQESDQFSLNHFTSFFRFETSVVPVCALLKNVNLDQKNSLKRSNEYCIEIS